MAGHIHLLFAVTATMRKDPDIMGLCGETKIANKSETWVTMIQGPSAFLSFFSSRESFLERSEG